MTEEMPHVHIDPEPEFIPAMSHRQKNEHIGVLARALYPPKIAGLICWYVNSKPKLINDVYAEVKADADARHFVVTMDAQGFLVATNTDTVTEN